MTFTFILAFSAQGDRASLNVATASSSSATKSSAADGDDVQVDEAILLPSLEPDLHVVLSEDRLGHQDVEVGNIPKLETIRSEK